MNKEERLCVCRIKHELKRKIGRQRGINSWNMARGVK